MKALLLLRHGKSSWKDTSLDDFDRPLTKRGKRAARGVGEEIRRQNLVPDLILASVARRVRQTAKRVAKATGYSGQVAEETNLYLTGVRRHLDVLTKVDDTYSRVLLIGHNPDLEDLAEHLTGDEVSLPTGALVCIDLTIDSWAAVFEASGKILFGPLRKD